MDCLDYTVLHQLERQAALIRIRNKEKESYEEWRTGQRRRRLQHKENAGGGGFWRQPWTWITLALVLFWIWVFMMIPSCALAETYDSEVICNAIYKIEGGESAKKPYGILSVECHGEQACRRICINTVENEFTRWQSGDGLAKDYLESLALRYAPIGVANDPANLNRHWLKNLKYHLAKK